MSACSRCSGASTTRRRRSALTSILREAGCANVNLDLMFAVPTQTRAEWEATLEKTIALRRSTSPPTA